jgi:Bcr/CflA subfamily drug resistance transporter
MKHKKLLAPSIFMICLLSSFPRLSETIYTPSLPDVARSLHTTNDLAQWTLSIYFMGFALGTALWGTLSDKIGRRKAMLAGLFIYLLGTIACTHAPNINWLLVSRMIQAFGASVGSIITQTVIRDIFTGKKRNQIYSVLMMALAISPAIGPLIGGFLVQWFSWRANFIFLSLLAVFLFAQCFFNLPETHPSFKKNEPRKKVRWIKTGIALCKNPYVWACAIFVGVFNGMIFSYFAEGPFIFINILHFTPSQYGFLGIFIALSSFIGSKISHNLNNFYPVKKIMLIGTLVVFASTIVLLIVSFFPFINLHHRALALISIMIPISGVFLGLTITLPNILSTALSEYSDVLGTAGSIFGMLYYIIVSTVTFFMGVLHNGSIYPMPLYFFGLSVFTLIIYYLLIKPADLE